MNDKNTIIAIVLSAIVLLGWQYFIGMPQMEKQRQEALLKQQQTTQAPAPGTTPSGAPAPTTVPAPGTPPAPGQVSQPGAPPAPGQAPPVAQIQTREAV